MSTDLTRIGERARKEPNLVFTSLYHHVTDLDNLRDCYEALDDDKAVGVDGVTKEHYGENLEENLQSLSDRLKRMGYRPQPSRRSYIPKSGSKKGRPLGISCFEDKIVELGLNGFWNRSTRKSSKTAVMGIDPSEASICAWTSWGEPSSRSELAIWLSPTSDHFSMKFLTNG